MSRLEAAYNITGEDTEQMSQPSYEIAGHEILAETPELRMVVLTLAAGQEVPWHWHSNLTDTLLLYGGPR